MSAPKPYRVAIAGASGIGKHHAKWWTLEGAEICGFVGSSEATVERTRGVLREVLGVDVPGYTSIDALLETQKPDLLDVCSPPKLHMAHTRAALDAGCHVLCEKPLSYSGDRTPDELLEEARDVVALAEKNGLLFGFCTQYSVGAETFGRLWTERHPGLTLTHYHGHLESPAKGREPDPGRVWVDLSPHSLSVLLALLPDAEIDWSTLDVAFKDYEAKAAFDVVRPDGTRVRCDLVTRNALKPPLNVRHFKLDGYAFVVNGENDAQGVYRAVIETPDGTHREPDMMHALIGRMRSGQPVVEGRIALKNLEWMLQILDFAKDE